MPFEKRHVDEFNKRALEQDRTEALLIDDAFNASGYLPDAIATVETSLTESLGVEAFLSGLSVPGAEKHGYQKAKNAMRWLNFREAMLKDEDAELQESMKHDPEEDEVVDQDDIRQAITDSLEDQWASHKRLEKQLIDDDHLIINLFAALQAERIRGDGAIVGSGVLRENPFYCEGILASQALLNIMDSQIDGPKGVRTDETPEHTTDRIVVFRQQLPGDIQLNRTRILPVADAMNLYSIRAFGQTSEEHIDPETGERDSDVEIVLEEMPYSLDSRGYDEDGREFVMDLEKICFFINTLSRDRVLDFTRSEFQED